MAGHNILYEYCRNPSCVLTAPCGNFTFGGMDHRQPRNTTPTKNKAQDKKRADALRQNLLKRKQQTRARSGEKEK